MKWNRLDTASYIGYTSGDWEITDNGAGLGSTKGSGRWALVHSGTWIRNLDTLAEAKAAAEEIEAQSCVEWTFFKDVGGWGYRATVNGHSLVVAPGLRNRWVAIMDGQRLGTRPTEYDARAFAEGRAR